MNHIEYIKNYTDILEDSLIYKKLTGSYYTHDLIIDKIINELLENRFFQNLNNIRIIEPFCGDGRLISKLISKCYELKIHKNWDITLIDIDETGLSLAKESLDVLKNLDININYNIIKNDSFTINESYYKKFDIVLTNPPWEIIKPESNQLIDLTQSQYNEYVSHLKKYDLFLTQRFPHSQPKRKFAGWGTNLSRVGIELCYNLLKEKFGILCLIIPASFFADDQSQSLRSLILKNFFDIRINYFPAESKLFKNADIASATIIGTKFNNECKTKLTLTNYDKKLNLIKSGNIFISKKDNDLIIPITLGLDTIPIFEKIKKNYISWENIEKEKKQIWCGREIDETKFKIFINNDPSGIPFIKGRMINRFSYNSENLYLNYPNWKMNYSCNFERIAWRDISRATQKRRMIASIIPAQTVTGNSLNIVYLKNPNKKILLGLLNIINSLCFEFQLKFFLATNHISLSSIRKTHIPDMDQLENFTNFLELCSLEIHTYSYIEAYIAKFIYSLTYIEFEVVLNSFNQISLSDKEDILNIFSHL